jgi:hypothetical protein
VKLSITLPSIHPDALARAVENINAATRLPHEILVVSPFTAYGPNVTWIVENERRGCNFAQAAAAKYATGDLLIAHADDFHYTDGWDDKIVPDFLRREKMWGDNYLMGLRYDIGDRVGTVFGMYYGNFPLARRSSAEKFGWLGPEYKIGFGDSDLSMRVWDSGGHCEFSAEKVLYPVRGAGGTLDDERKQHVLFAPEDMELFLSRWADKYGEGWDTMHLRGFNLDVDIEQNPQVVDGSGRSIFFNDPHFTTMAKFVP